MSDIVQQARQNLEQRIRSNPYPGRGLVIGLSASGDSLVQAYWIMGRSPNSRNRVFCTDGEEVWTEPADPSKVEDPSLIIYRAMRQLADVYIVSNGDQTDTVFQAMRSGGAFEHALATRQHEPDAPNYTPRISGILDLRSGVALARLSVIKASPFRHEASLRHFFDVEDFEPGCGHCITTYVGDGNPLPPFEGEPFLVPLEGADGEAIADALWAALDDENKVSLAVKTIGPKAHPEDIKVAVRNKYQQTGTQQ